MSKINITLNGQNKELSKNLNISSLIQELDLDETKIAIERNLEIVQPETFGQTIIEDGDNFEIVHFIGGG